MVRRLLADRGHDVLDAHDGRSALRILDAQPVDLVITDIYMPGEDGITLIRQVNRRRPKVPIISMSGGSRAGNLDAAAVALGARQALSKPFMPADLLAAVEAALESLG